MTKEKSKPKAKPQQPTVDAEIKKHIRRDLIDLAGKLKHLAARFEACGFMPSINQYASQIGWKTAALYDAISVKTWPGDKKGETHSSLKPSDDLSQGELYVRDIVQMIHGLTQETYLRNADPQQASVKMMRVADLIQEDLQKHKEVSNKLPKPGVQRQSKKRKKTTLQKSESARNDSKEPKDLITLAVALKEFNVSRSTLKLRLHNKSIREYRKSKKGLHIVSRTEIARKFLKR